MNVYRYKTWNGSLATVEATTVRFERGFVVFEDAEGRVVLAEDAQNVRQLSNTDANGRATRRLVAPAKDPWSQ